MLPHQGSLYNCSSQPAIMRRWCRRAQRLFSDHAHAHAYTRPSLSNAYLSVVVHATRGGTVGASSGGRGLVASLAALEAGAAADPHALFLLGSAVSTAATVIDRVGNSGVLEADQGAAAERAESPAAVSLAGTRACGRRPWPRALPAQPCSRAHMFSVVDG